MAKGVMDRIKPLHVNLVPPEGAIPMGATPAGAPLYKLVTRRSRAVPNHEAPWNEKCENDHDWNNPQSDSPVCKECGVVGVRLYKKHQLTGEKLVAINKPEVYDHEEIFYLESTGQGHVENIPYRPPTDEELAQAKRNEEIDKMQRALPAMLVDRGLTVEELANMMAGRAQMSQPEVEEVPTVTAAGSFEQSAEEFRAEHGLAPATADQTKYPLKGGGGWWTFSNGTRKQCKEEQALEIEGAIIEARIMAEAAPDY